ncbi:hypothetical protein JCM24511_05440 [Saitozyma sp. JCM 24511]|nr:hypothetical protein JCM24511_05440 [Saitozyma sp. JCM 24511]
MCGREAAAEGQDGPVRLAGYKATVTLPQPLRGTLLALVDAEATWAPERVAAPVRPCISPSPQGQ